MSCSQGADLIVGSGMKVGLHRRLGASLRAVRIRRRWRQEDVATRAGLSRESISKVERGLLDGVTVGTLIKIGAALDVRLEIVANWRGGDLDRLLHAGHSALHESVAVHLASVPGWVFAPEVSFAIRGERGVIDVLAWHAATRSLLVNELKTEIADVQEMVGTLDRKRRLAGWIGAERGWRPLTVSSWLIVVEGSTNRRRAAAHRTMLHAAYPSDGHTMRSWLLRPAGSIAALSFWSDDAVAAVRRHLPSVGRVRDPSRRSARG